MWQNLSRSSKSAAFHLARNCLSQLEIAFHVPSEYAICTLGEIGEAVVQHPDALPMLIVILKDKSEEVRRFAAEALGRIGKADPQYPALLSSLVIALRDQSEYVRSRVIAALGEIGEAAIGHPDVLPSLVNLLEDPERWRRGVEEVLSGERKPNHGDRSRYFYMRTEAARALGKMGEAAAQHPDVLPALVDASYDIGVACQALGKMARSVAQHPEIMDRVADMLTWIVNWEERGGIRTRMMEVIAEIGEAAARHPGVMKGLMKNLNDIDAASYSFEDLRFRCDAADALSRLMARGVRIFESPQGNWVVQNVFELSQS